MDEPTTLTYSREGRVARITLDRPERGNGITLEMPRELAACVERANLDPEVHVIALAGNGKGFCGGYDLVGAAEADGRRRFGRERRRRTARRSIPPSMAANHDPDARLGPDGRLRDDEPQRARVHEPVPLRQAGRLQGARLLRRRRHRHGAVLRPAGDRRRREDRLPAGAGVGRADDRAVGAPDRGREGQAAAVHGRLAVRRGGGRVGPGDRGGARRAARRALRDAARARSRACRSTSW